LHEATVATFIRSFVTVDKLLFGESDEFFVFEEILTFDVDDGRESPARTTLALVFNWSDSTMLSPIV